jgi:predicted nucleic acid-binding protein
MLFLDGRLRALPEGRHFISVITRMEILADPAHTKQTLEKAEALIGDLTVIPLNDDIERIATLIRRSGSPRPKLPDAIVAATAVLMNAPLVSADDKLLRLSWPGLQTLNIA